MRALTDFAWQVLAFAVSRRCVANYLIDRAARTPYIDLPGYMRRDWLFNGYASDPGMPSGERSKRKRFPWLPSIRVHHILREDLADHPHDHPWDARTIILRGWYLECRPTRMSRVLERGATVPIRHGAFHHIAQVSPGGAWTLFITWRYCGGWGFLVDGRKVPWRRYLAEHPGRA